MDVNVWRNNFTQLMVTVGHCIFKSFTFQFCIPFRFFPFERTHTLVNELREVKPVRWKWNWLAHTHYPSWQALPVTIELKRKGPGRQVSGQPGGRLAHGWSVAVNGCKWLLNVYRVASRPWTEFLLHGESWPLRFSIGKTALICEHELVWTVSWPSNRVGCPILALSDLLF